MVDLKVKCPYCGNGLKYAASYDDINKRLIITACCDDIIYTSHSKREYINNDWVKS